jgi:hypothetical protein
MLCDVSHGPDTMSLISLYRFASIASDYGYSTEIYSQSLINRLSYPLLLLICFIFSSILAWNSRIFVDDSFKFSWLLLFPIIIAFSYTFVRALRFVLSLLFYAILAYVGNGALFISLFILVLLLSLCLIRFVSLKSDKGEE